MKLTGAVSLYLVSGMVLKVEIFRWLSSRKLMALKQDNIQAKAFMVIIPSDGIQSIRI